MVGTNGGGEKNEEASGVKTPPPAPSPGKVQPSPPPTPSTTSDPLKSESYSAISSIQGTYGAAIENGLVGRADDHTKLETCQTLIDSAWKSYREQKYAEALDRSRHADTVLSEMIQSKGLWWRLLNLFALPLFILLLIWLAVLVWTGYNVYLVPLHSNVLSVSFISLNLTMPRLLRLLILTAVAGGLGAVLRQVYNVSYQVKVRQFKRSESVDILMAPFIGFLFGFLAYLMIAAGLLVITQKVSPSSSVLYVAVAFLLGFNWKATHDYMLKVTEALLGGSTPPQQQEQKIQSK